MNINPWLPFTAVVSCSPGGVNQRWVMPKHLMQQEWGRKRRHSMPPLSAAASGDHAGVQSVPAERDTRAERNNSVRERVQKKKRRLAPESASPSRADGDLSFQATPPLPLSLLPSQEFCRCCWQVSTTNAVECQYNVVPVSDVATRTEESVHSLC